METLKDIICVICAEYHGCVTDRQGNSIFGKLNGLRVHFPNDISADIVISKESNPMFGYDGFEIAVLKNGKIVYDTPITDDVVIVEDLDGLYYTLKEIGDYAYSISV